MCRCTLGRYLHIPDLIKIGLELAAQDGFQFYYINCYNVQFHYCEKMTFFDIWIDFLKFLVMNFNFFSWVARRVTGLSFGTGLTS